MLIAKNRFFLVIQSDIILLFLQPLLLSQLLQLIFYWYHSKPCLCSYLSLHDVFLSFVCFSVVMLWAANSYLSGISQYKFLIAIYFSLNSWTLPQIVYQILSPQSLHLLISLFSVLHCQSPFFPITNLLADHFHLSTITVLTVWHNCILFLFLTYQPSLDSKVRQQAGNFPLKYFIYKKGQSKYQ